MTRRLRNKYILILAAILFLVLFFSSCVTQKKAETITEETPIVEEIVVEEETPKLPTVKAVEATEEMWAQIIAQIPPKEMEEAPAINTPIVIEEEPIEETPEIVQEEVRENVEEVEDVVEEEPKAVEEEVEEVIEEPTFTIIEDEKPQVELLGEDTGVVIKDDNSELKAIENSSSPDKILQGSESDLNSTMPSWLYSEKERENSSPFTPIINIYETKEEEIEDDGIKPEDILEYGNEYKANREDSVSITKMQKKDLYNAVLKFFATNYPYVCMVFVVIIAVFLVKSLVKHINIKKSNDTNAEKGVEFNSQGNDANDYVFNPMARAINDVDTAPSNKEDEQTTTSQEQKNEVKEEVKGVIKEEQNDAQNSFVYVEKLSQETLPEATVFKISKENVAEIEAPVEELVKEDDGDEQYYIEEDEDIVIAENEYEKEEDAFFKAQKVLEEQFGVAI